MDNANNTTTEPHDAASAPPNEIAVTTSTEYKEYFYNEKHDIWTLVSLQAPCQEEDDNDEKRAPIDVVAVIDKSGSMAGEKLDLVKKTLEFVLTQLGDKDRLSLVTYDTNVYLDFALKPMNKDNKDDALQKIQSIRDGSSTNLSGGLMKGLCQVIDRDPETKNEVASVLLLTDGLANEGIRSASGIVQAMKNPKKYDGPSPGDMTRPQQQAQAAPQPHRSWLKNVFGTKQQPEPKKVVKIESDVPPQMAEASVYTFGFGADHDPQMLKEISDAGNGMYYYIENGDKIAESFGHCLGGLLSTVAQGIQLEVVMEDGVLIKEVHSGKAFEQSPDNKRVKINVGDLQSEERRDFVLEISIDSVPAPCEQTLFNAQVDYFSVITDSLNEASSQLKVTRSEKQVVHDVSNSNIRVNKERSRVKMTKAMKFANTKADKGDLTGARSHLLQEINEMRAARDVYESADLKEDERAELESYEHMLDDLQTYSDNVVSKDMYKKKGAAMNRNMLQCNVAQRSANVDSKSFASGAKMKRAAKAKKFVSE